MFEIKDNEQIGAYLKKLIKSKYPSDRQFCISYVMLRDNTTEDEWDSEEVRKLTNRLSQILKGTKAIQIYDLPLFSELLSVSCEEMLSAGVVRKPISNRRTNYNIAFSKDKKDWIEYINREDCIAAYTDEFGKTVIDYAIEFKNYKFLRFLMENRYIQFVSEQPGWSQQINFGASCSIKKRPYKQHTLENEFYENKLLRTKLIALAIENEDDSVLEELRAREVPTQLCMDIYQCDSVKFDDYYDEEFIDVILNSKDKVFNYFIDEYQVKGQRNDLQFIWLYPFFNKLIEKAVKVRNQRAKILLDKAIKHNQKAFEDLKNCILFVAKEQKNAWNNLKFQDIVVNVLADLHFNKDKTVYCFYGYYIKNSKWAATNIIKVDVSTRDIERDVELQSKINNLNNSYDKIVNMEAHLYKKQ